MSLAIVHVPTPLPSIINLSSSSRPLKLFDSASQCAHTRQDKSVYDASYADVLLPQSDQIHNVVMSFPNVWHHRKVADTASRGCDVCYKPTTSVLATPGKQVCIAASRGYHYMTD